MRRHHRDWATAGAAGRGNADCRGPYLGVASLRSTPASIGSVRKLRSGVKVGTWNATSRRIEDGSGHARRTFNAGLEDAAGEFGLQRPAGSPALRVQTSRPPLAIPRRRVAAAKCACPRLLSAPYLPRGCPVKRFYHQLASLRLAREAEHPKQDALSKANT